MSTAAKPTSGFGAASRPASSSEIEFQRVSRVVVQSASVVTVKAVARLAPEELQAARVRSGKLGGRPRKPTVDEARAEALERLVPKAIRVLEEHLESGRPDAWRSACRILDHSWGRPAEHVEVDSPPERDGYELDLDKLSTAELEQRVRARRAVLRAAECREPEPMNAASSSLSG